MNERERGFEALLKPIQDVIAKDWKVKLCNYLEIYIEHLHTPGTAIINFSEAAILIQNSSKYYCKRVDLMYNWVRQYAFNLTKSAEEQQSNYEDGNPSEKSNKKTKPKKLLNSDDFELLGFSHTDHNINVKMEKIGTCDIKHIVLNTSVKTYSKPGTCCAVYKLPNGDEEMGSKEEFRLHWRITNDGRLHEHFNVPNVSHIINTSGHETEPSDNEMDMGELMDMDADDNIDVQSFSPPESDEICTDPPLETQAEHESKQIYKTCAFGIGVNPREFKRGKPFIIPNEILVQDVKISGKKRSKKLEPAKPFFHLNYSEILSGNTKEDMIAHKISKNAKLLQSKKNEAINNNNIVVEDDSDEVYDDNCEDYDENLPETELMVNQDQHNAAYELSANLMDEFYKIKNDACLSIKRVAAWHESIQPILQAAEERSIFDVHEYGTRILDKFDSENDVRPFSHMVTDLPKEEICRYFLSSLMLANTYNIELSNKVNVELSKDCLQLKLLSRVRHHEELDDNVGHTAAGP